MAKTYTDILTPVGRIVWGDAHKSQERTPKNGGENYQEYAIGLAIPKGPEGHWSQTEWGAKIWAAGHNGYGAQADAPTFSWKIIDGDSAIPNKNGKIPREQTGYAGHWVLSFSSRNAPRLVNRDGSQEIVTAGAIKCGYYVQVFGNTSDNTTQNGPSQSPGVYLNPSIISLQAYGDEIRSVPAVNPSAVGFGAAPLPAGASSTPIGGGMLPPAPSAPAPVVVTPNHAFAAGPATPPPPTAPVPAVPAKNMLPAANGVPYEQYMAAGWTDAQLIQHGYMAA